MKLTAILLAGAAIAAAAPASAAINVVASNVDLTNSPYTLNVDGGSYTFSFDPRGSFDPDPILVNTDGNAQVVTVFGQPSVSRTNPPNTFGPNSFPGFGAVPDPSRIGFSLVEGDLGLRYGSMGEFFYGYARVQNSQITRIAFQSIANVGIIGGAVPEPSTWALLILGFGAVGGAMRYRRGKQALRFA